MPTPLQQLQLTKREIERLLDLKDHPSWKNFESFLENRIKASLPTGNAICSQDHALQFASQSLYAKALRDVLEDLNALDAKLNTINQDIETLQQI
jgi:hypothetical protein